MWGFGVWGGGVGSSQLGWKLEVISRSKKLFRINALSCWPISDIWKNKDESTNKEQMHDEEMIREAKRNEVEEELRRQVDYLMREELDLLKIVSGNVTLLIAA